eukprot:gene7352-475_t
MPPPETEPAEASGSAPPPDAPTDRELPHLRSDGTPAGFAFGEWLGEEMYKLACFAFAFIMASRVGKAIKSNHTIMYIYGFMMNYVYGALLQKLDMSKLEGIDFVGGPAKGLTVIITGPTSGIGLETAAAMVRRGAKVVLACRNLAKGDELKAKLEAQAKDLGHEGSKIEVMKLDVSCLKSVRDFADTWEKSGRELHILINNAGIFNMAVSREQTSEGFEAHMASNYLGHYLLTLLLVPALKRGAASENATNSSARVVHVASSMHLLVPDGVKVSDPHYSKSRYSSETLYAQSKLCQIMFAREMRRRLGPETNIQVFAIHPGMVLTDVVRTLPDFMQRLYKFLMSFILLTPSQGARASVYCATFLPLSLLVAQRMARRLY